MKLLGIGSNLPSREHGSPAENCRAAIAGLEEAGLHATAVSRFYETAPVPASAQPWFINVVIGVETDLSPREALYACLAVEATIGRIRSVRNAPRVIDIDILAWDERVVDTPDLTLPHPRMTERAFTLVPLADIAPDWRHPVSGRSLPDLLAALPAGQQIRPLDPQPGPPGA